MMMRLDRGMSPSCSGSNRVGMERVLGWNDPQMGPDRRIPRPCARQGRRYGNTTPAPDRRITMDGYAVPAPDPRPGHRLYKETHNGEKTADAGGRPRRGLRGHGAVS